MERTKKKRKRDGEERRGEERRGEERRGEERLSIQASPCGYYRQPVPLLMFLIRLLIFCFLGNVTGTK